MGGGSFGGLTGRSRQYQPQQPQGQMMQPGFMGGGGRYGAWPGYGMGGMPGRYGGLTGYQSYGQPGAMFGGYSGGNMMYGPGSWSAPGSMPYGGGSGMFGGGSYNTMANQMANIPPPQMMATPTRGGFGGKGGSPMGGYQPIQSPEAIRSQEFQARQEALRAQQPTMNPMNPASGCYYDSSQDDYICPGR